ncbi:MAG: hypothetical protein RIE73_14615 [Coleofasciculus sp. C1-SOL-03]|jgi:hypothetical protein|uniref:hypothetical protein n=1 Tax=Coleofasciculus sp. C1-SOL-03 TaxID=3069522 RepID=UPI0032F19D47
MFGFTQRERSPKTHLHFESGRARVEKLSQTSKLSTITRPYKYLDSHAIALSLSPACDRAFPFPRYTISPGIEPIPHPSAMEAYPGKHITAQKTLSDTAN